MQSTSVVKLAGCAACRTSYIAATNHDNDPSGLRMLL